MQILSDYNYNKGTFRINSPLPHLTGDWEGRTMQNNESAYAGQIKAFLEEYRLKKYSGGIKMAFEEGLPKTFWSSDVPDFKTKPIGEGFDLDRTLQNATKGTFSGSLFFILENGEITNHYHIETIQGRKLEERLANCRRAPRKIIAIRKQGVSP